MKASFTKRIVIVIVGLAFLVGLVAVAILLPDKICHYESDTGSCQSATLYKVFAALGGVTIGGLLLAWSVRGEDRRPWEAARRNR